MTHPNHSHLEDGRIPTELTQLNAMEDQSPPHVVVGDGHTPSNAPNLRIVQPSQEHAAAAATGGQQTSSTAHIPTNQTQNTHPRSSTRLATKMKQSSPSSTTASTTPPNPATTSAASGSTESAVTIVVSPSLTGISATHSPPLMPVHTPLSTKSGGSRMQLPPSSAASACSSCATTPSPSNATKVQRPPVQTARRKLLGSGAQGSSGLPPMCTLSPSCIPSPRNQRPVSPMPLIQSQSHYPPSTSLSQPMDCEAQLPGQENLLLRSASCPTQETHRHKLPCFQSDGVNFISPRTAALLLSAHESNKSNPNVARSSGVPNMVASEYSLVREFSSMYDLIHILDARFPYEYHGGHIVGAVNITSHADAEEMLLKNLPTSPDALPRFMPFQTASSTSANGMDSSRPVPRTGSRVCVLVHCEFSRHRGPKCFKFIRKRDREVIGVDQFPSLYYPELYVIQGGYQTFFNNGFTQFCQPQEYVAMLDRRFKKEYHECWRKMKSSSSSRGRETPYRSMSPAHGSGGGGGSGSGDLIARRANRTRSWTEMDSPNGPTLMSSASTNGSSTGLTSPSLAPRSLQTGSLTPGTPPMHRNHAASPTQQHSRVNRGLNLVLDQSASAVRRATSAFSFHHPMISPPLQISPTGTTFNPYAANNFSSTNSVASFVPFAGGLSSPVLTPTGAAGLASPSPSYGWSNEGREDTPSPFTIESPRISSVISPYSWLMSPNHMNLPNSAAAAANNQTSSVPTAAAAAATSSSTQRSTPISIGEESPRSGINYNYRSRSSSSAYNPPVFTNAKNPAAACLDVLKSSPTVATTPLSTFSSPSPTSRFLTPSQSSPSSALHQLTLHGASPSTVSTSRAHGSIYSPSVSQMESMSAINSQRQSDASVSACSPSLEKEFDHAMSEVPAAAYPSLPPSPAPTVHRRLVETPSPAPARSSSNKSAKKMRLTKSMSNEPTPNVTAESPTVDKSAVTIDHVTIDGVPMESTDSTLLPSPPSDQLMQE